ncbi:MAG: hypothetical protein AAFQ51_11315 [Pseudomonadota bacterium]
MKLTVLPLLALTLMLAACADPEALTYVNAEPGFTTFTAPQFAP